MRGVFWSWKTERVAQIFCLPIKTVYWMLGEYEKIAYGKCPR